MARVALVLLALALLVPGGGAPEGQTTPDTLVQVAWAGAPLATRLLRERGGMPLAPGLGIWRARPEVARELATRGLLRVSEPDRPAVSLRATVPPDPYTLAQWWRSAVGADRIEPPGPGKPVTVVDTGLDAGHPEFAGRPNTILLNRQAVAAGDPSGGHGTAVSSVIAAPANGIGLVGVYPEAVLQEWDAATLTVGELIRGIDAAAARGPGVINMSFALVEPSGLLEKALLSAFRRGSLLVAGAGNEYASGNRVLYPSSSNHVLTVAATDEADDPTFFSSASLAIDLAAPGQNIPVAVPVWDDPLGFSIDDGTSYAAPIVSGAAAWVWTARPGLDNTQLFELMRQSAKDIGESGFDQATGYGLLDIPAALTRAAVPPDPQEPNDDVEHVRAHGLFREATAPLTRPGRPGRSLAARLDLTEDPQDVYRVWLPARGRVTVTARADGNADLELWETLTRSVNVRGVARRRNLVAESSHPGAGTETVSAASRGRAGRFLYVRAFLPKRGSLAVDYTLTVRTAAVSARR